MSANIGVLRRILHTRDEAFENSLHAISVNPVEESHSLAAQFAEEQVRGLVRRVFFPGWPRPARQVVICAAEKGLSVATLCCRTAELLAMEGVGKVCLVEGSFDDREVERRFGGTSSDGDVSFQTTGAVRTSSRQIKHGLWLVSAHAFLKTRENLHSAAWLRSRLGELRREFDYAVIHAPSAGERQDTALLAHLADGLVLALDAHRTRRQAASRIREQLMQANVRLLGVVLQDRTFPIPEKLYQRL